MTITLTEQQARIVLDSLDIATRQGGLQNAAITLPVAQAIQAQMEAEEEGEEMKS
jgi:hypothetical protein